MQKTKKSGLLALLTVAIVVIAGSSIAFAAWVKSKTTATQTLTVGTATELVITPSAFSGDEEGVIYPGDTVTQTITLDTKGVACTLTFTHTGTLNSALFSFSASGEGVSGSGNTYAIAADTTSVTITIELDGDELEIESGDTIIYTATLAKAA